MHKRQILACNSGFAISGTIIILVIIALIWWIGSFFGCGKKKETIRPKEVKQEVIEDDNKQEPNVFKKMFSKKEIKYEEAISKCASLFEKNNYKEALIACEEAERFMDTYRLRELKGKIKYYLGDTASARREFAMACQKASTPAEESTCNENFIKTDKLFAEEFLKKKYTDRKLLMPVKEIGAVSLSKIATLFPITNMPKASFPIGHPSLNELYVAHPYKQKFYVPFDSYETDFLNERLHEFCELAQAFGAVEVRVESVKTKEKEYGFDKDSDIGVESSIKLKKISVSGGPKGGGKNSLSEVNSVLHGISISQIFSKPVKEISLPSNLVWFDYEPSWQQLYRQRVMGNLLEHREKIESKKNRVVQSSELLNLKLELKASSLLAITPGWEKIFEEKLQEKEDTSVTIYVKFQNPKENEINVSDISQTASIVNDVRSKELN